MEKEQIQEFLNKYIVANCRECRAPKTDIYPGGCPRLINRFGQLPKCYYSTDGQRSGLFQSIIKMKLNGEMTDEDMTQIGEYIDANQP